MNESIAQLDTLLRDVVEHLKAGTKPDRRAAVLKLERLAAVATTLAFDQIRALSNGPERFRNKGSGALQVSPERATRESYAIRPGRTLDAAARER